MVAHSITIGGIETSVSCTENETILNACLRAGVPIAYECRSGECGDCVAALAAGTIDERPGADPAVFGDADRAAGRILACMCRPRSDLELRVDFSTGAAASPVVTMNAMVEEIVRHGPRAVELAVATPGPIAYRAGQYFDLHLPGIAPHRSFSAANRPGSDVIRFHIRVYPDGAAGLYVTQALYAGAIVTLTGPYGHFGWSSEAARPALLIAGGTGMAPMRAMLDEAAHASSGRPIRYLYGARREEDLYCLDEMAAWTRALPDFRFLPVLSEEPSGSSWAGARGLVTEALPDTLSGMDTPEVYLCGPPPMIDAALPMLDAAGIASDDIRYDKFTIAR
jgi:NAD(P)H-flavin reductase/ferredoxin